MDVEMLRRQLKIGSTPTSSKKHIRRDRNLRRGQRMTTIQEAKAQIEILKQSMEEQISLLASEKKNVEDLMQVSNELLATSSQGVDSKVEQQLSSAIKSIEQATQEVHSAIA